MFFFYLSKFCVIGLESSRFFKDEWWEIYTHKSKIQTSKNSKGWLFIDYCILNFQKIKEKKYSFCDQLANLFQRYFDFILNDIEGRCKKSWSCDDRQKASEPQLLHLLLWVPRIENRLPNRHLLQTLRQSAYPWTSWGLNHEEKIHTHQSLLSKSNFLMIQDRIDALIKIYRPNVHPDYPNGGRFTPFL